ncbi:uncharacterized protein BJ212DRAFT_1587058 [Suillus subaureus]|uniref:Uncharacterized protein n=1 Tax=Suillus subaureus TaxID=48587 RepID=A0A9P7ECQ8_9AGAM|nr:uncharacterized protein BJ212DRAFT_1587058 [Suillus subaureus]KAG1817965.1 hypothetical protein BJ212DRAFT_1587058 [Suillus subaureus]
MSMCSGSLTKDRLDWEVTTCEVTTAFRMIPVPRIYSWDSDVSNHVGAEYMKKCPFSTVSDCLTSNLRAELGEWLIKAVQRDSVFSGVPLLADADTGRVIGLISFEAATIAPLWECAMIPRWLEDAVDPESSYEGRSHGVRSVLRAAFFLSTEVSD